MNAVQPGEIPRPAAGGPEGPLRDVFGHSPLDKMFDRADVYGVGYEEERARRTPVRLGLIGAGGVAQSKWLPALARLRTLWDPVSLVGVADPEASQAEKVGRIHGCGWYADHRQLLEKEAPDAVLVCTPDAMHASHVADALSAGVAVLVEKPFCTSLVDAAALCRRSEEQGTVLMPVCNLRFSPPFRRARASTSRDAAFAPPISLTGRMVLGYDYVELLEGATVHLFDLCRFFLGDVTGVSARGLGRGSARRPYPFRQAMVALDFDGGSLAQLFTSSSALSLGPWLRVEVHGAGRWLAVDDVYELALYDSEAGPTKSWRPVMASTLVFDEEFGGYLPQLEHFLQVVRKAEPPMVPATDGYKALELVVATHLSMAGNDRVALPLSPADADSELDALRAHWADAASAV